MRAPARLPRQNEMSDLLEYVAVAAGLEFYWVVAGDAIGNGRPSKSLRPRQGLLTEFTVAQAGIKGVARRSLSAWRGSPPTHLERRSAPAGLPDRTYARINLNEVRNENLIPRQRCSGASGRRKPRAGDRAGAETAR